MVNKSGIFDLFCHPNMISGLNHRGTVVVKICLIHRREYHYSCSKDNIVPSEEKCL